MYISELDTELWADFKAAVVKKYGGLRRVRGRSYITAAVEGLISRFIVEVNEGVARARNPTSDEKDKFEMLLEKVRETGATQSKLSKYIRQIFNVRQSRSVKGIGVQFFTRFGFPDSYVHSWTKGKMFPIEPGRRGT